MKKLLIFGILVFGSAFAQSPSNTFQFGDGTASNKTIKFKTNASDKPAIRWSNADSELQFSNDGTNFLGIGSGSGSGSGGINILTNPGFEAGIGGWTASPALVSVTSGANRLYGAKSVTWDPTSGSQTVTQSFALASTQYGILGGNCAAQIKWKNGDANYNFKVTDGSNTLSNTVTLYASASAVATETVVFPCPSSGNIVWTLTSTADAALITLDNAYMGNSEIVTGQISQAKFFGSARYAPTASCVWSTTSATFASFSADSDCPSATVTGNAATPATKVPGIRFQNGMPPGTYYVVASGIFQPSAGTSTQCGYRFTDGTNDFGIANSYMGSGSTATLRNSTLAGFVTYSAAQGDTTIQIQAAAYGGTGSPACAVEDDTDPGEDLIFQVYYFPSSSEQAYRPDLHNRFGSVKWANAANCSWVTASGSFGNYSADSDCTLPTGTQLVGSGSAPGTKIPGAVFSNLPAGSYMVIAQGSLRADYASSTTSCNFRLSDGTNTGGNTSQIALSAASDIRSPVLQSVFTYSSFQSAVTIQIQGQVLSGGGNCIVQLADDGLALEFILVPLSQNISAALLVGSVTSNSSGLERIERAQIANSGTCSITSQSGTWLTSPTHPGTGQCAFTIATGIFSSAPSCFVTLNNASGAAWINGVTSTTAVGTETRNTSFTATDADFYLTCMGPR